MSRFLAMLPTDRPLVLVPHSNAGLYVPRLTLERSVIGYVFVDAILPPIEPTSVPIAPRNLLEAVAAAGGRQRILPPWTQWWSEEDTPLPGLYPDDRTRKDVEDEAPLYRLTTFGLTSKCLRTGTAALALTSLSARAMPTAGRPRKPWVGRLPP